MKRKSDALPKWGERFLRVICPHELLEEIEGDLLQQYHRKTKESGVRKANLNLIFTIIRYGRPGIFLRKRNTNMRFNGAMINSYFITSYRHVLKDKTNSFFKLAGLTLALFSLLVVGLYLSYQLSFDRYHEGYDRIYRVNTQRTENGNIEQYGIAPVALGPMLHDNFPEIESFARFDISNGAHLQYQQKVVFGGVFGVDSTWFDVFSYQFIKGSSGALSRPATIVLTETLAKKIFGDEDPLHKALTINNEKTLYEVTGVIRDIPQNSHLRVEAFIPITRTQHFNAQQIISPVEFVDNSIVLFVKLHASASPRLLVTHLEEMFDQYVPEKQRHELGFRVFLQPLKDIYLDPPLKYEFTRKGSMVQMYAFALLGVFLIIIACINYSNLSLAGFVNRSREMGVRKVLGGRKSQILVQIALDTVSYGVFALLASVFLLYLMFPEIQDTLNPNSSSPWSPIRPSS